MEEIGLDLKVLFPNISETLTQSLGLSHEAQVGYQESMEKEIEDHEGYCCFKKQSK